MIRKHPNVSDANFDILIDIAIKDELTGMSQKTRSSNSTICFPGFTSREHLMDIQKTLNLKVSLV
jgi:hypothetical protein